MHPSFLTIGSDSLAPHPPGDVCCRMAEPTHILNKINGKALLAPMLATTDIPFRSVCRESGAALTFTEMVSAAGILRSASNSYRNAVFSQDEHPVGIQLVAADPETAAAAVRELLPLRPDIFDLNSGCPNDRICEAGAGAQLLGDIPRLGALLRAAVTASTVPVSVKLRLPDNGGASALRDLLRTVEDAGAIMVTLHARTRHAPYDEKARWETIGEAVQAVSVPVVGNGDVFSAADAQRLMRDTGCAAVMVARGALGTPWIFRDIDEGRDCDIDEHAPGSEEMCRLVTRHLEALQGEFGAVVALPRLRKHAMWYARRFPNVSALRAQLFAVDDAGHVLEVTRRFFESAPMPLDPSHPERQEIERRFRHRVLYWTTSAAVPEG
ncbi:MAG: tRNA-dihydrouridine synthase [Bacteroidetes bacterium]|nr:tRNA-dihydrouridine synthase [Bacteroidota bacterium]